MYSATVMKCHDPKELKEERVYLGSWFQRDRVHPSGGTVGHGGRDRKQKDDISDAHRKLREQEESRTRL